MSEHDLQLLLAAFLDAPEALAAWERWRDGVDWDGDLGHGSYALLPFVYRNVTRLGGGDRLFPRFKGVMRRSWVANQQVVVSLAPTLTECEHRGVELLVLPPASRLLSDLALPFGRHEAVRCAVRPRQAAAALRGLLDTGWRPTDRVVPRRALAGYVAGADQVWLRGDAAESLLLTWTLRPWFDDRADEVWARTVPAALGPHGVRELDPTDAVELLLREPPTGPWFGPVAGLLTTASLRRPDWGRLAAAGAHRPFPSPWADPLDAVRPVLERWGMPPALPLTALPLTALPGPQDAASPSGWRASWARYRDALGPGAGRATALLQLPGYLQGRWGLRSPRAVPGTLARALLSAATGRGTRASARAAGS